MNSLRLLGCLSRPNIVKILSYNYSTQHPLRFTEVQDRLRDKDGVSRRYQLIYKAPMEKWLNYLAAYVTYSTACIACTSLYYGVFVFDKETMNNPVILGDDVVLANSATECLVYIASFIGFHVALKVVLSKYVLRLYQDGDDYLAVFRGHTYNSIVKHKFHLNEVKKLKPTKLVAWGDARFSIGSKQAILLENYFKTPEFYNYLLYKKKAVSSDENE